MYPTNESERDGTLFERVGQHRFAEHEPDPPEEEPEPEKPELPPEVHVKLDNEEVIPLFPNARQNPQRVVAELRIYKVDPPDDGFKGALPPTADLRHIAEMYGNGMYNIEAVSETGKILQRRNSVKIAFAPPRKEEPEYEQRLPQNMLLLDWQRAQHKEDQRRVTEHTDRAMERLTNMFTHQLAVQRAENAARLESERNFMMMIMQTNREFFATMQQQQQREHERSAARQRDSADQTYRMTMMSFQQLSKSQDPHAYLNIYREALALGSGNQGDDEDDDPEPQQDGNPFIQAVGQAANAISEISSAVRVKSAAELKKAQLESRPPPAPTPTDSPRRARRRKGGFLTPEESTLIVQAKKLAAQKGIDFAQATRQFGMYLAGMDGAQHEGDPGIVEAGDSEEPSASDPEDERAE